MVRPDLDPLVLVVEPVGGGKFSASREDGRVIVASSRTPFLDSARILISEGYDPTRMLIMRHARAPAVDAFIAKVGTAARTAVSEATGPPKFCRWVPFALKLEKAA
jgi:hypothetical protein